MAVVAVCTEATPMKAASTREKEETTVDTIARTKKTTEICGQQLSTARLAVAELVVVTCKCAAEAVETWK